VTRDGLALGEGWYGTTFEIDFWSDYMWGYEVEARAYDFAGNVMAKTAGGGLTYLIGKLVAGFLSFLLGPAIGGAVFGFFLGMLMGLFEDLSIFLQIGEIFNAITQLPKLIGQLFGNPSILVALFVDMIHRAHDAVHAREPVRDAARDHGAVGGLGREAVLRLGARRLERRRLRRRVHGRVDRRVHGRRAGHGSAGNPSR
jgi:hypothetical protein